MKNLPPKANLDHLKKQAKTLLRLYRAGDPAAAARFAEHLPAARASGRSGAGTRPFRLHDAQSCLAREYGFASWADLGLHVDADTFDPASLIRDWPALAYGGDVSGRNVAARPRLAARLWQEHRALFADDPYAACAVGDLEAIARTMAADPGWIDRPGGPLGLPPLVAVTHSRLGQVPDFLPRLRACARALLQAGADPNQGIFNRFPPASLATPDATCPLSALYGAAGINRDPVLTEMLLDAGADPNDGESLYHSLENPECTRVLLRHRARIAGTNAMRRALDMTEATALELLLAAGGDPNEAAGAGPTNVWGAPLLRAIAVRRSPRHIAALLAAGADPMARTPGGIGAYRLAMQAGLVQVAALLRDAGADEALSPDEAFVAACARGDGGEAGRIQALHPDLPAALPADRLRLMPDAAAWGSGRAVEVMVERGWPIDVRGGDWDASALHHAVFRGDAGLTRFLLAHGASRHERNGFGGDVLGTLAWASVNEPTDIGDPDWAGCARAILAQGCPRVERDPSNPEGLMIDGRPLRFSESVTEVFLEGASPDRPGGMPLE